MSSQRFELRPIYTIDAADRLVEVNEAFIAYAEAATHAPAGVLIGRPIWDFVRGAVPKQLWRILYQRVRAVSAPVFVPLRLETATTRSLIDLELHSIGDQAIRHVHECVSLESRAAVALLDPNFPRDERLVTRCAWCARVQVKLGSWMDVERAHAALNLQASATLPTLEEGACTPCRQSVLRIFPARAA